MKINYIKYHNYRCFGDMTIYFNVTQDNNISMVVGANGTGKTEMLFSFQWVLYDFDFTKMREKDATPYSLNSTLHRELENNKHANSKSCWVELSFSHKDLRYLVKREETFIPVNGKIKSVQKISLEYTKPNGETIPKIQDKDKVDEILTRIIPKSILEGIIFDGERMKKLNSADDNTKTTIRDVITLVTNERLFSLCIQDIKCLKDDIKNMLTNESRDRRNTSVESLQKEINQLEDDIEEDEISIAGLNKNINEQINKLEKISESLSALEDAKNTEEKRKGIEKDLSTEKKNLEEKIDDFYKDLTEGYILIAGGLIDDVQNSIENIDIPLGLNSDAVKSILKREKCICGCKMTKEMLDHLQHLVSTLPPDNINSTISEMARQMEMSKQDVSKTLKLLSRGIRESEMSIAEKKKSLSEISDSMIINASAEVRRLETERTEINQRLGALKQDKERRLLHKEKCEKRNSEAKKELAKATDSEKTLNELNARLELLELFNKAISKIEERNREDSLRRINNYLSETYMLMSEDKGRDIYICQFNKKHKYQLTTFYKESYKNLHTNWTNNGDIATLQKDGMTDEEIREEIIIKVSETNSTGQSKMNSLAFAKAILDYSNETRTEDALSISHDYPFLIDSPFTELDGQNLDNSAKYLHTFASQIILMVSNKSLQGVNNFVSPYVNSRVDLEKNQTTGITNLKKE